MLVFVFGALLLTACGEISTGNTLVTPGISTTVVTEATPAPTETHTLIPTNSATAAPATKNSIPITDAPIPTAPPFSSTPTAQPITPPVIAAIPTAQPTPFTPATRTDPTLSSILGSSPGSTLGSTPGSTPRATPSLASTSRPTPVPTRRITPTPIIKPTEQVQASPNSQVYGLAPRNALETR